MASTHLTNRSANTVYSPWLVAIGVLIIITVLSYAALKFFVAPHAWIAFFFAIASLIGARAARSSNLQALGWNIAVALIVVGGFEAYLHIKEPHIKQPPQRRDIITALNGEVQKMTEPHEILGYAPIKDRSGVWTRHIGNDLVFRSRYTIDSLGFRVSPPDNGTDSTFCVFFFGCSFTWGQGVNDEETLPYQVGIKTEGRFRIFNLAFRGYGPHQMLAALEHNIYENVVGCQPRFVVYQLIPDHIGRAAGFSSWDTNGPRFVLGKEGEAVQAGTFERADTPQSNPSQSQSNRLIGIFKRSLIYRKIVLFFQEKPSAHSAKLTSSIIKRAANIVAKRHPEGEFHVIAWPSNQPLMKWVIEDLESAGVSIHSVVDILPEYDTNLAQYRLHKFDEHPNAKAHELIADYVTSEILENALQGGPPTDQSVVPEEDGPVDK